MNNSQNLNKMNEQTLIPAKDFCLSHKIELEVVLSLSEFGLIEIVRNEHSIFIPEQQISRLERILIFNQDLNINLEGIDTIFNLLDRIDRMQQTIATLENRVDRFKSIIDD